MDLPKLGKYTILCKIGAGAMGEVFKAYDPILGREVAIKTMSAAIGADDELRQRFHREAQSAARLNHPNIITIFDFGEEQGRAYIAMELLEGEDLTDLIARRTPMTLDAKVGLMEQMAEGLAFAHARDVVHRDLKPANIHIHRGGQVKIMDFGLARLSSSNMTRAGMMMGTPNYMSPEQVRGERATACSDVFSLGSVFYELLTYRKPFDADSLHGILFQVMQTEPEPLATTVPGLPPALCDAVERAMAKTAESRYANGAELREALRTVRAALGAASIPPPPPAERTAPVPAPRTPPPDLTEIGGAGRTVLMGPDPTHVETRPTVVPPGARRPAPAQPAVPPIRREVARSPARTEVRPSAPTQAPPPAPSAARPWWSRALPIGAAALILAAGYTAVRLVPGTAPPASPPSTSAPPASLPPPTSLPTSDAQVRTLAAVAEARRSLDARDYRSAAARAEAALVLTPGDADAERILGEARDALRRSEAAARELRQVLVSGDADRASLALGRLMDMDPRNPELPRLTLRVNQVLKEQAMAAQRALDQARQQPPLVPPRAASPPATPPPPTPAPPTPAPATAAPVVPAIALTPAQVEAARRDIRGVLQEYQTAVETRNAEYLRRLAPGLDYETLRATFAAVAGMGVKIDVKDVSVSGDTAAAQCLVTYTPNPRPAGKIKPVPTLFRLKRVGAVWIIEEVLRR